MYASSLFAAAHALTQMLQDSLHREPSGYGLSLDAELKQLRALKRASAGHPVDVIPTFLGAHTIPPEFKERRADYVSLLVDRLLPEIVQRNLAEYADAFVDAHAFFGTDQQAFLAI